MNFQSTPVLTPLKVLVVNPLSSTGQITIIKIMSGLVFGKDQLVDLRLLVFSNETSAAEALKWELHGCGFACMNSIAVSSDLPHISDADIFCFITNFQNPNSVDFNKIDDNQFDFLYLIIKIANSLSSIPQEKEPEKITVSGLEEQKPRKPVIMADGIVTINILKYFTKNIPSDVFFCPTSLPVIAKNVLGDVLKVTTSNVNNILVWGANDEVFHIEVEKPIVVNDKINVENGCDWDMIGKDRLEAAGLDHTEFNESWLKKGFIKKVAMTASKNPYGCIHRASEFAKTLNIVWKTRTVGAERMNAYASVGVISDGSLGTIKGFAYVLPLVFVGDTWRVNKRFQESFHLKQELKRMNKAVKDYKEKFIPYCKRFLEEDVTNLTFIQSEDSESAYSFDDEVSLRM